MFKREARQKLELWSKSETRQPLVIRGARQVGKTTLVNDFGEQYSNYLYLNLEDDKLSRDVLEDNIDLTTKVNILFSAQNKARKEGKTLLFIDEIQNSPVTIMLLRYFYEQRPDIHVIAAGSLLENIVDVNTSFPVGRVQFMPLRPCSFREFVAAMGEEVSYNTVAADLRLSPLFHSRFSALFSQYVAVGGMPRMIDIYSRNRDLVALNSMYSSLLTAYRDDVEKYVKRSAMKDVLRFILQYGWSLAGETISLGKFAGSNYQAREVREAFNLLSKAMLAELVYPTTAANFPAIPEIKRSPKLIWLDTGLVNFAAGVRQEVLRSLSVMGSWRGHIAEHIVAQELLTLSDDMNASRCFWVRGSGGGNKAQVDFLLNHNGSLCPIEVKAGHNSHLRSIHSFIDASQSDVAIRVWGEPLSVNRLVTSLGRKPFTLINIPFYLLGELHAIIERVLDGSLPFD